MVEGGFSRPEATAEEMVSLNDRLHPQASGPLVTDNRRQDYFATNRGRRQAVVGNVASVARQLRLLSRLVDEADVTEQKHAKTLA